MEALGPTFTAELFAPLHAALVELLDGLAPADWERPAIAGAWRVRDVAAHLLEIDLRRLSVGRDGHRIEPGPPMEGYADLVGFLNDLNRHWIAVAQRFSPRLLVQLLEFSGPEMARLVTSLPPHGPAPFAVDWAGERSSENWFDIGRDFTERWHHQMQIRIAVGAPGLLQSSWLRPVLDISVRALPRAYAGRSASDGTSIVLEVAVDSGAAAWSLRRGMDAWQVWRGAASEPAARVRLDADTAWRLFFNGLTAAEARERATVEGDAALAEPLFGTRAIIG